MGDGKFPVVPITHFWSEFVQDRRRSVASRLISKYLAMLCYF